MIADQNVARILNPFGINTETYLQQDNEMCLHESGTQALVTTSADSKRIEEATKQTNKYNHEHSCAVVPDIGQQVLKVNTFRELLLPTSM